MQDKDMSRPFRKWEQLPRNRNGMSNGLCILNLDIYNQTGLTKRLYLFTFPPTVYESTFPQAHKHCIINF